jgi:hypothetical protein
MTARRRPETYENKKPQITQITQIFFSSCPFMLHCNFVANFLVIFMADKKLFMKNFLPWFALFKPLNGAAIFAAFRFYHNAGLFATKCRGNCSISFLLLRWKQTPPIERKGNRGYQRILQIMFRQLFSFVPG